jgi:hypothetical protein
MKDCKILSRTNKSSESLLEKKLFSLANGITELHSQYSEHFNSPQFMEDFGNYVEYYQQKLEGVENINPEFEKRLDDNGEPRLFFDKKKSKYYYLNKDNKKSYFPEVTKQLKNIISNQNIKEISKFLAHNYLNENFDIVNNFTDIDFDGEILKSLKESIHNKIKAKLKEIKNSEDAFSFDNIGRIAVLESISEVQYLDEWVQHVSNQFKTIKLNYVEETDLDNLEAQEETRDVTFGKPSIEKSYKVNINNNVKLMLSFVQDPTKTDPFFNEPVYKKFDDVFGYLLGVLPKVKTEFHEDTFENYKLELNKKKQFKPYLSYILQQFENPTIKDNENFKNGFVQTFTLSRNPLLVTTLQKLEEGVEVTTQDVSEVGSKGKMILSEWNTQFADYFLQEDKFKKTLIKKRLEILNKLKVDFSKVNLDNISEFENSLTSITNLLKQLKVEVTSEGLDHYIYDTLEEVTNDAVRQRIDGLLQGLDYLLTNILNDKITPSNNVLNNQKQFNDLAKSESVFTEDGSDSTVFTKKMKWVFSKPSYVSNKINSWINDPKLLKEHIESTAFNKGSIVGKYLLALDKEYNNPDAVSKERLSKLKYGIFNLMQQTEDAKNGVDSRDISKNDKVVDYINKILAPIRNAESWIDTPTPGDKSTEIAINYGGFFIKSNVLFKNGKLQNISEQVTDILFEYFKSEYNRMKEVADTIKESEESGDTSSLRVHYHLGNKNGLQSQLFPSLAPKFTKDGKAILPKFEGIHLFDNNGYPLMLENGEYVDLDVKDSQGNFIYKEQLIDRMLPLLEKNIKQTYFRLIQNGVFELNNDYSFKNNLIDNQVFENYNKESKIQTGVKIAADIFINGLIHQVEYSKLFSGDLAYYKNTVDYKKRVPATYTDGLQLVRLTLEEQNFNASIIGGVKIPVFNIEELKRFLPETIWKEYQNNNSTDAQAWITPARWEFLLTKMGKWSPKLDVVRDKMLEINKEPFTEEELKLAAQPLKGVYFEINDGVPVYLKYSQAVLLPRFIKNTPLQNLYDRMTENPNYHEQIHELITIDGVKVGSINPNNIHTPEGDLMDNFELNQMSLKNSGWKLQQDLPTKTYKDTMLGSQIQKNIFQGLSSNLNEIFNFEGNEVKGQYIADEINRVVGELSNIGLESLKQELQIDDNGKITDLDSFYSALADQMIERDAPNNIVEALQANLSPLAIPQAYSKIMNMFASLVSKRIIKITTNGGSFIQVSDFGLNKNQANKQGIIWTPWAQNKIHHYEVLKDKDGNDLKTSKGKLRIKPAGLMISGSLIAKYVPDYRKKSISQLFGTVENDYNDGLIDKRILQNIIGYRIPNQGLSSNDAFEVVGILPEEKGDSVIAYTGITTKTGSDFDIDKMFLMIPSFKAQRNPRTLRKVLRESGLTDKTAFNILKNEGVEIITQDDASITLFEYLQNKIENEESIAERLQEFVENVEYVLENSNVTRLEYSDPTETTKKGLSNRLIELYQSVLLNSEVIEDIMQPLDFEYMSNDQKAFVEKTEIQDLDAFDPLKDIDSKFDYKAGKAGVGMEANALMDFVRGTMATISLINFQLTRGNTIQSPDGTTEVKLDNEYSEELSDKELEGYMKLYNQHLFEGSRKLTTEDLKGLKRLKIGHSLSAVLNAFVDIAKDNYITKANWNTFTTNTGNLLLRAGVHPFIVNGFLNQPILRRYSEFVTNNESITIDNSGDIFFKFKNNLIVERLNENTSQVDGKNYNTGILYSSLIKFEMEENVLHSQLSIKNLAKTLKVKENATGLLELRNKLLENYSEMFLTRTDPENVYDLLKLKRESLKKFEDVDIKQQLQVLAEFKRLQDVSKNVRDNVSASRIDTDGYGKNITDLFSKLNLIEKLFYLEAINEQGAVRGFESKLTKDGKDTLLSHYKKNSVDFIQSVMENNSDIFTMAHKYILNTFNILSIDSKNDLLIFRSQKDSEYGTTLETKYLSYILSGFPPFKMSKDVKNNLVLNFPKEFNSFKTENKGEFEIVDELHVVKGEKLNFIIKSNNNKSSVEQDSITDSWRDLLVEHPEFAENLIKYSYLTSGFEMNKNQFFTLIPHEWFLENNINNYLKDATNELAEVDYSFINQMLLNNSQNNVLIKKVFPNQKEAFEDTNKNLLTQGFISKREGKASFYVKEEKKSTNEMGESTTETLLYELRGYTENQRPVYVRVSPLGQRDSKGNIIVDYNFNMKNREGSKNLNLNQDYIKSLEGEIMYSSDYFHNQMFNRDEINTVNGEKVESQEQTQEQSQQQGQLSLFSQELFENNKEIFENNGVTEEMFNQMLEEFGQQYVEDYLKKCKK